MRVIKDDLLNEWLAARRMRLAEKGHGVSFAAETVWGFGVEIPGLTADLFRFARDICWQDQFERCYGALLCITEWSLFGTGSDTYGIKMFKQMCMGYGQDPAFSDSLVTCVFDPTEGMDDRVGMLSTVILSGWDAFMVPAYGHSFVSVHHDGMALFVSTTPDRAKAEREKMSGWKIIESVPPFLKAP